MNFEQNGSCDQKMLLLKYPISMLFDFYSSQRKFTNKDALDFCTEGKPHMDYVLKGIERMTPYIKIYNAEINEQSM